MCEKIAVMYAGHIVEYGTTDEIFYNPQHEYTKGCLLYTSQRRALDVGSQDRLIALSTCAGAETNGRVVLLGRLRPATLDERCV